MPGMTVNKCPVCGMDTGDSTICAEHVGIQYHFCTQQCRANFIAHPRLYIGKHAPKRAGRKIIKRRIFVLDKPLKYAQREQLIHKMNELMSLRNIAIEEDRISVDYDLIEITADQIEKALDAAGFTIGNGWAERLKRGWTQYTEETELDNLDAEPGACCNKPPSKAGI